MYSIHTPIDRCTERHMCHSHVSTYMYGLHVTYFTPSTYRVAFDEDTASAKHSSRSMTLDYLPPLHLQWNASWVLRFDHCLIRIAAIAIVLERLDDVQILVCIQSWLSYLVKIFKCLFMFCKQQHRMNEIPFMN